MPSSMPFLALLSFLLPSPIAAQVPTIPTPGQPPKSGSVGQFELIGNSLVSSQQMFLGTESSVYIVDKVENNPTKIDGHPAWASEWSLGSNDQRAMDALTNTFCAGGNVMGNGTWVNVGGNQAVTYGGAAATSQNGGGPYDDPDGRRSIRLLNPCDDKKCDWILSPDASDQRWYPTVETLEDGSLIIIGGCRWGGYVNDAGQDVPTYEFFPPKGDPIVSPLLQRTLPANLYPLTWLLPSGKLFMQSNWATVLLDYHKNKETALDDVPDAVRVYPASGGSIMLPLTPANNYTATLLFCGGSDVQTNQWNKPTWIIYKYPASASCVTITPDQSGSYVQDDPLPEPRSMASLIQLPDGKVFCVNGARKGTAGYGNDTRAIGQSYADDPVLTPVIYDPSAPAGQKWSSQGLSPSTIPRMYHSAALLLPDGSVMVSGSNPNSDYATKVKYNTEYRTEVFYPSYYNSRRPQPSGLLRQLSYGGPTFDVSLTSDDLSGDISNINKTSVVIIRPGFSTHAINMGQRMVELDHTYSVDAKAKSAVLHVSQLPPNPAILAPGPALIFVVVNGVPSIGAQIMVGSGKLGKQDVLTAASLPPSEINYGSSSSGGSSGQNSAAKPHSTMLAACVLTGALWTLQIFASFY